MSLSDWRAFLRRRFRPCRPARARLACPLRVEELEGRWVPAAFFFSTGNPDGLMATASRPASGSAIEIESADDFDLPNETQITQATFTGLLPTGAPASSIQEVVVEIYRVFPKDSNLARTITVPTRSNSPSDVQFDDRDSSAAGQLTFSTSVVNPTFTANNSVLNGIHPAPNQTTGGEGAVTGEEVTFTVNFTEPFTLPADHYFFVPQVLLSSGNFFWLSAPKPIVSPGTSFPAGVTDLQEWIRNSNLEPDWLRVGTDIVGGSPAPTFNAAFSLTGQTVTPQLTSLGVSSVVEGTPGLTLALNGSNFTQASTVQVNGTPIAAHFVNSGQLTVTLPAFLLAEDGALTFAVSDSGATTGGLTLAVTEGVASGTVSVTRFNLAGKGANATITGSFLDQVNEDHVVRIDWGDGTRTTLDEGIGTGGSFTVSHHFKKAPKHKNATVQVLDDGSPIFQLSVALVAPKHHRPHHGH
jgi:hypothetical protein